MREQRIAMGKGLSEGKDSPFVLFVLFVALVALVMPLHFCRRKVQSLPMRKPHSAARSAARARLTGDRATGLFSAMERSCRRAQGRALRCPRPQRAGGTGGA